ncbi:MAG: prepilin peptidase [Berryella intestinalis]|uniref:prepilin peptidase n=1 Tax=Berryella intestinalis TaxID=1531429 RepID=UPI002A536DD0|nr:prepilin peptidase [Berryella intestinalis]MDD7369494.1 prepilin peptidase [Berryella intestinalis]MDY3128661.1 prepilin peptidase [Berryella intestinalis]
MLEFQPIAVLTCAAVVAFSMARCVAIDLRERRIPRLHCYAIAFFGSILQLCSVGMRSLVDGAVFGAFSVLSALVLNRLLSREGPADAIGGGDIRCMFALSLATGSYAPVGFAACFLCAAAFGLIAGKDGRGTRKETIPLAPSLSLWLVCGLFCSLYALNF